MTASTRSTRSIQTVAASARSHPFRPSGREAWLGAQRPDAQPGPAAGTRWRPKPHSRWPVVPGPRTVHGNRPRREQRIIDLRLQLEERDEDLTAARAANRELMAQLNATARRG